MSKKNNLLRDGPEIILQYSTEPIYMLDAVFQRQKSLERMWQSVSETDYVGLRTLGVLSISYAICSSLIFMCCMLGKFTNAIGRQHLSLNIGLFCFWLPLLGLMGGIYALWKRLERIFPIRALGISAEGISVHHGDFSIGVNKHFPWSSISNISVVRSVSNQKTSRQESFLLIRGMDGNSVELAVNAIRSIEERKLIVDALKIYARKVIDVREIDQLVRVSETQDIPFTQLWSQALRSSFPRSALSVLPTEAILQEGRYMIKEQIGGGGQGAIYLTEMLDWVGQRTEVVLKEYVIPNQEHVFDRKRAVEQFEREVHLLARLKHRNLANLVDAFVEDHRAYLVIEYLHGITLRQLIKMKEVGSELCCQIGLQLCDVLQYLHSLEPPVVHLDVSPENVIVMPDNSIRLIDFNTSSDGTGLRTKLIAGKQRYMSPEQYRNDISRQCDIFGLGCTLFYMLTGIEPEPLTVLYPAQYKKTLDPLWDEIVSEATSLDMQTRTEDVDLIKGKILRLMDTSNSCDNGQK